MLIYVKTFSYYRKSCQELKCLFAKERRVVDVATRVDVLEAGDPEAVAPHSANWPEQPGGGGGGTRGQHRRLRSDLEAEIPHALLVRLNQVGALLLSLLHYAEH